MRRQLAVDKAADLLRMIARAEVRKDDQLVAEAIGALNHIIQMHMAELVDLFAPVIGSILTSSDPARAHSAPDP